MSVLLSAPIPPASVPASVSTPRKPGQTDAASFGTHVDVALHEPATATVSHPSQANSHNINGSASRSQSGGSADDKTRTGDMAETDLHGVEAASTRIDTAPRSRPDVPARPASDQAHQDPEEVSLASGPVQRTTTKPAAKHTPRHKDSTQGDNATASPATAVGASENRLADMAGRTGAGEGARAPTPRAEDADQDRGGSGLRGGSAMDGSATTEKDAPVQGKTHEAASLVARDAGGNPLASATDGAAESFAQLLVSPQPDQVLSVAAAASGQNVGMVSPTTTGQAVSIPEGGTAPNGNARESDASAQLAAPLVRLASAADGASHLQVSMHPRDLGAVNIHLNRSPDGSVTIIVAASEPATLRSLIADQAHLHAALDAASVPGADRHLSFELTPQNQDKIQERVGQDGGAGTGSNTNQDATTGSRDGASDDRSARQHQADDAVDGSGASLANAGQTDDRTRIPALLAARIGFYRSAINITA